MAVVAGDAPAPVSTEQMCKDGMYTPMQITATCASAGRQTSLMPPADSAVTAGAAIAASSTTEP